MVEEHENTMKELKKAKSGVSRLTIKVKDAQNTITKLHESLMLPLLEKQHNVLLQKKFNLADELSVAIKKANIAEEEAFTYKAKNSELSEQNVKLLVSLTNSKSSLDMLGKQLSEAIALRSYELKSDDATLNAIKSNH